MTIICILNPALICWVVMGTIMPGLVGSRSGLVGSGSGLVGSGGDF